MTIVRLCLIGALLAVTAAGCGPRDDRAAGTDRAATTEGDRAQPGVAGQGETGTATVYAGMLQGRETASGEAFDHDQLVAAHRTHPLGTQVRVTNLENNRSVTVRVADRTGQGTDAIIDLSRRAARELGIDERGQAQVRVEPVQ